MAGASSVLRCHRLLTRRAGTNDPVQIQASGFIDRQIDPAVSEMQTANRQLARFQVKFSGFQFSQRQIEKRVWNTTQAQAHVIDPQTQSIDRQFGFGMAQVKRVRGFEMQQALGFFQVDAIPYELPQRPEFDVVETQTTAGLERVQGNVPGPTKGFTITRGGGQRIGPFAVLKRRNFLQFDIERLNTDDGRVDCRRSVISIWPSMILILGNTIRGGGPASASGGAVSV